VTVASISVIVPCYNTERYLGAALESVVAQRPAPLEVIVVDDGSTDGSGAVAESFGGVVRCYRHPHRGISAARNAGLAMARGDTVAFLDADDLWPQGSLACRLDRLTADDSLAYVSGLVEQFLSPELPEEVRQTLLCPPGLSRARCAGAMLIRQATIARVGSFDETLRVGETLDWVARADLAGLTHQIAEHVVLQRRIHETNTGSTNRNLRADYLQMLKKSLDRQRATGAPASRPVDG
jgi:hypothetical protein